MMKLHRSLISLALALCLVGTVYVSARASSALMAKPTAAAVVDVQKVFEGLSQRMQIEAELKGRKEQIIQERQTREQALKQLQEDMDILAPGSPAHAQKQQELEKGMIDLKVWLEYESAKLDRERTVRLEGVYRKMLEAIGKVAQENSYDLVLFKEAAVDFRGAKQQEINTAVQMRKVLYHASELEVTDQVVQKMNNEFQNMTQ